MGAISSMTHEPGACVHSCACAVQRSQGGVLLWPAIRRYLFSPIYLSIYKDGFASRCVYPLQTHTHTHTITITHKTHQSTGFGTLTLPLQHHHAGYTITQAHNKFLQYKTLRCTKYPFKHTLHLINAHPHTHTHTLITIFSKNKTYRFDGWIGYFDIF